MLKILKIGILAAVVGLLAVSTSCTQNRKPAAVELPPVKVTGLPSAPADEPPVVKTADGYATATLPGIPPVSPSPLKYITYVGASN